MASFGSFLGTALGTDPQAFNRGAENQLKLQALQRAEQARLNLKDYAPNQMNLGVTLRDQPNLDSSQFGSDQLFIEPPKKVEPEVVKPIEVPKVEENVTEESTVGDDQVIIDNQETKTPETLASPSILDTAILFSCSLSSVYADFFTSPIDTFASPTLLPSGMVSSFS